MPNLSDTIAAIPWPQGTSELVQWPAPDAYPIELLDGTIWPPIGPQAPLVCAFGGAYQQLHGGWPESGKNSAVAEDVLTHCGLAPDAQIVVPDGYELEYYSAWQRVSLIDFIFSLNDVEGWPFDQIATLLRKEGL